MADQEHTKNLALELANRPLVLVIAETAALIIIALVAFIGNSSVLYVFLKSPRFRSVTNYYLITLALSDVAYSSIVMQNVILGSAYGRDVSGPRIGTALGLVGYTLVSGSLQTTTLIAVNRFFCVVKPEVYRRYFKPKPALLMIIGMWVFSVLNAGSVFFIGLAKFDFYPGKFCYLLAFIDRTTAVVYNFLAFFLFFVLPMSVAGLCYWNIYKLVKGHQNAVGSSLNTSHDASSPRLTREEIHITRSLLALVCGFVICWLPCSIVNIVAMFYNLSRHAEMIFIFTASLSTAINPIIFNIFNKPFRKQFLSVFCGWNQMIRVGTSGGDQRTVSSRT